MAVAASTSLGPVLITGGNGFVASHIIDKLREAEPDIEIHGIDVDTSRNRRPKVNYHQCDISRQKEVDEVVEVARPVTVIHTASPEFSGIAPAHFHRIIVDGTRYLLNACQRVGTVRALVHTSTSSVIHDNLTDLVNAEEDWPILRPPQQQRVYSLCKADAEEIILAANRARGDASILAVNLRPCMAFGKRDTSSLGKMVAVALQGKSRFQIGDGRNLFDFMYAGNLADLHLTVMRRLLQAWGKPTPADPDARVDGKAFNVTNDDRWFFWDFQRGVAAAAGIPVKKEDIIPRWVGLIMGFIGEWVMWATSFGRCQPNVTMEGIRFSTMTRTLNLDKTKRVLGYKPRVSIQDGLDRGVKWFLDQRKADKELYMLLSNLIGRTRRLYDTFSDSQNQKLSSPFRLGFRVIESLP